jgi:hypothetical protein
MRALEARGIATDTVLKASGMECVPVNDPLARVPMSSLQKLFDAAVELTARAWNIHASPKRRTWPRIRLVYSWFI